MERADVVRAAEGASVTLHAVNPPGYRAWGCLVLPMIDSAIAAARAAGGARVVLPGTINDYSPTATPVIGPATPQRPLGRKGAFRAEMECRLVEAAPEVPSLVIRAGDFFGPGAGQSWFQLATAKRPLTRTVDPGRAGIGHAWAYLPDLAEAIGRSMVEAIRRSSKRPDLPERHFPWWLRRLLAPFGGFPREVLEIRPCWRHAVQLDGTRLVELLCQVSQTNIETAVASALAA